MNDQQKKILEEAGIDVAAGRAYFMDMDKMYEKYLFRFPTDPTFPELFRAVEAEEREPARIAAHSLKSITGTLGFKDLNTRVKATELAFKEGRWEEGIAEIPALKEEYAAILAAIEKVRQSAG